MIMVAATANTFWRDHGDFLLILISAIGEVVFLGFMAKQKVWRKFPIFFIYILWAFLGDCAALYLQGRLTDREYYKFYAIQSMIDAVIQFAVLVELAWSVLRPVRASLPRKSILILALLIVLAGLAIWPLAGKTTPAGYAGIAATTFHLEQTIGVLRIVCFLIMAGFSQLLSIGWRDRELQIVTGLGFYSIASLMITLGHSQQTGDADTYHWLDQLSSACYFGTLSYWVMSFATKEQERKEFSPQMQNLLLQLGGGARAGRIALTDLPSKRSRNKD
jgi:hypothetical protein